MQTSYKRYFFWDGFQKKFLQYNRGTILEINYVGANPTCYEQIKCKNMKAYRGGI